MRRLWLGMLVAVGAMCLGGCLEVGTPDGVSKQDESTPTCSNNSDCGSGMVCDPTARWCVSDRKRLLTVSLRLFASAANTAVLEEQYASVPLDSGALANFQMHRPLKVVGRAFLANNPLAAVTNAEVAVVGPSEIPGLEAQVAAVAGLPDYLGLDGAGMPSKEGSFEFYVLKNKAYDIYIHLADPQWEELPPYHVRRSFSLAPNSPDPYTVAMDVQVPAVESYPHITGKLRSRSGPGSDVVSPVVGAKVLAFAKESGNVSSTAITDAEGAFELRVQPPESVEGELYTLQVRPSLTNELVPEVALTEFEVTQSADLGDLEIVGSLAPQNLLVLVTGLSESDSGALVGAVVRAESSWAESGSLVVERVLQGSTWTSLKLPPGTFTVTLIPPPESTWATVWQTVQIEEVGSDVSDGNSQQVEMAVFARGTLAGHVLAPSGKGVGEASVRAIRYGTPFGSALSKEEAGAFVFSSYSEEDGHYSLTLDGGTYLVLVDPPARYGLPRTFFWDIVVVESLEADLVLPLPIAFSGEIQSPEAAILDPGAASGTEFPLGPSVGVRVEFYDPQWPSQLAPLPMAEATTDEDGRFSVLLPAQTQD